MRRWKVWEGGSSVKMKIFVVNIKKKWLKFLIFFFSADPRCRDLDLWREEAEVWSVSAPKELLKTMHQKDIKRQDILQELLRTEKHHCRTLVILKQV